MSLRDECLTHAAAAAADQGDLREAISRCGEVQTGFWHGECFFLVAESRDDWGPEVRALCEEAEPYRRSCLDHVYFSRARRDPDLPGAVGEEAALREALEVLAGEMLGRRRAAGRSSRVDQALAKRISERYGDGPFDRERCGEATEYVCALSYVESMRGALRETDRAALCRWEVTPGRLADKGLKGWTPASEELARRVWEQLCRPGADPTRPRTTLRLDRRHFDGGGQPRGRSSTR